MTPLWEPATVFVLLVALAELVLHVWRLADGLIIAGPESGPAGGTPVPTSPGPLAPDGPDVGSSPDQFDLLLDQVNAWAARPPVLAAVRQLDDDERFLLSLELGRPVVGDAFELYAAPVAPTP